MASFGLAGVSAKQQRRLARDDRGGQGVGVGAVDEGDVDAEAGTHRLEKQLRVGVELRLGDDVVARRAQSEDHRTDRAHARRERP